MKTTIANLLIIGFFAILTSCGSGNKATENNTTNADTTSTTETASGTESNSSTTEIKNDPETEKTPTKSELSNLESFDGKHPFMKESMLLEEPALKPRIQKLLGDKMTTFNNNTQVSVPVKVKEGILYFDGLAQHSGGVKEAALAIDLKQDAIFVGILNDGKVQIMKEKSEVTVPAKLEEWKNDKIKFDKATEVK